MNRIRKQRLRFRHAGLDMVRASTEFHKCVQSLAADATIDPLTRWSRLCTWVAMVACSDENGYVYIGNDEKFIAFLYDHSKILVELLCGILGDEETYRLLDEARDSNLEDVCEN
jgi:hypothetical protein